MNRTPRSGAPFGLGRHEKYARYFEMALGAWLVASAFLWRHLPRERGQAVVLGILVVAFAGVGLARWWGRFLNMAASLWIIASAFVLHHAARGTRWHDAVLGLFVFTFSLVPSRVEMTNQGRAATLHR